MDLDLLILNGRLCSESTAPTPGVIGIREGRIAVATEHADGLRAREVIDAGVMTALPHTGPMLGIDDPFVLDGMRGLAAIPGALTLYHAENPELNHAAAERVKAEGRADLRAWCDSRPDHGEAHSVRDGIWWQRLT